MGKLSLLCAVILACTSIGSALNCYQCGYISWNCKKNVTCSAEEVCATIYGSAAGHKLIKKRGCLKKENCNKNSTDTYMGIAYTTTFECCDGDTCNSATTLSSAHFSLSMALAMLGFWFIQLL